jgi:hypothetical protein
MASGLERKRANSPRERSRRAPRQGHHRAQAQGGHEGEVDETPQADSSAGRLSMDPVADHLVNVPGRRAPALAIN